MKFNTLKEAQEYAAERLARNSNEVLVEIEEKDGFFYAWFNVWD